MLHYSTNIDLFKTQKKNFCLLIFFFNLTSVFYMIIPFVIVIVSVSECACVHSFALTGFFCFFIAVIHSYLPLVFILAFGAEKLCRQTFLPVRFRLYIVRLQPNLWNFWLGPIYKFTYQILYTLLSFYFPFVFHLLQYFKILPFFSQKLQL